MLNGLKKIVVIKKIFIFENVERNKQRSVCSFIKYFVKI